MSLFLDHSFILISSFLGFNTNAETYLSEYLYLLSIVVLALVITLLISVLSLWGFNPKTDLEKTSAYECGFNPFSESRHKFDIKFYLVSLLFLVFDVEVIYLFPFSQTILLHSSYSFLSVWFFVLILAIGLIYEIRKKALDF